MIAFPGASFACSGEGAMNLIAFNEELGRTLAWATLFLAGASLAIPYWSIRGRRVRIVQLLLLVLHPGWSMSARHGDCGFTLRDTSVVVTGLSTLLFALLVIGYRRAKQRDERAPSDVTRIRELR